MELIAFPLLAFAPGVFWLWFFVRKDVYRPGPKRLLALTFFLGVIAVIPAGVAEYFFLGDELLSDSASLVSVTTAMLFVVGPVEETAKFFAVRLGAYRSLYFDEPTDALVYSAAASLGFASIENLIYIAEFGPSVMIGRAPLSTLAHVIFGSFWGYALASRVHQGSVGLWLVAAGLGVSAVVHGLFNITVFAFPLGAIALVALGAWWTTRRFDWAQSVSPFRYRRNFPKIDCDRCGHRVNIISNYCRFCGSSSESSYWVIYCSYCEVRNRPDASYCTGCGDRLVH